MSERGWLRTLREERGMTQRAVSEAAHITQAMLSNIEAGRRGPSISTAQSIGAALGFDWTVFYKKGGPEGGYEQ